MVFGGVPFWDGYPPPPTFLEVRILKGLRSEIAEVFILVDLKSFVFSTGRAVLEVFILIGLKSFVLIQI